MITKLISCLLILSFCSFAVPFGKLRGGDLEDVVYLKDGSIIRGELLEIIPDSTVKIKTFGGSTFVFQWENIERIVKEPSFKITKARGAERGSLAGPIAMAIVGGGITVGGLILYQGEDEVSFTESGIDTKESNRDWTLPLIIVGGVLAASGLLILAFIAADNNQETVDAWQHRLDWNGNELGVAFQLNTPTNLPV